MSRLRVVSFNVSFASMDALKDVRVSTEPLNSNHRAAVRSSSRSCRRTSLWFWMKWKHEETLRMCFIVHLCLNLRIKTFLRRQTGFTGDQTGSERSSSVHVYVFTDTLYHLNTFLSSVEYYGFNSVVFSKIWTKETEYFVDVNIFFVFK